MKKVVCFGEVLFDCFPSEKKVGGAPLNVGLRLHHFGFDCQMISCIGQDEDGQVLRQFLSQEGLSADYIQINKDYHTGTVSVHLDKNGNASYEIVQPVAWDHISISAENSALVKAADLFVFGSLVARQNPSKQTLFALLESANFSVFDLNLRPPHYNWEILQKLILLSDFIKCNEEELNYLLEQFQIQEINLEQKLRALLNSIDGKGICITLGAEGALLLWKDKLYQQAAFPITVVDTVGAGDSFLATLLHGLLTHQDCNKCLLEACAMGALVASKNGANPKISDQDLLDFIAIQ